MKTRIFTLYYSSTFNTVSNNIPVVWPSNVDPSGYFDHSFAHIYQSNIDYYVVKSPTMVIFSLIIFVRFKKSST